MSSTINTNLMNRQLFQSPLHTSLLRGINNISDSFILNNSLEQIDEEEIISTPRKESKSKQIPSAPKKINLCKRGQKQNISNQVCKVLF